MAEHRHRRRRSWVVTFDPGMTTSVSVVHSEILARSRVACAPEVAATRTKRSRQSVLVIDDDALLATALGRMLSIYGFEAQVASSPHQALERLVAGERYDVILCDVLMPGLSGPDLLAALRREAPWAADRMIFMTGGAPAAEMERLRMAYQGVILQKPFDAATLAVTIASMC
jgi:CheY-like chemotaxis protein